MQLASAVNHNKNALINYLRHHAVFKDSTTTNTCIVFDASRKTSNNKSLNDNLAIGPTIQDNFISLLIRFRKYKYGAKADVEKMY